MTAIPWTVVDPDTIERMIAVGLCHRYQRARRIRPSQGDGGLDVLVPAGPGSFNVENYQVKKFADGLNDSRKRQIKNSLKTAIATHLDPTSRYTISKWYLTLPMDLTPEQERDLAVLAAELEAPFPVEVFGLTQIEHLLLASPNIREYYIGDGMQKVQDLLNQITSLTGLKNLPTNPTGVQPNDAASTLVDLHDHINAADPHFNYDYQVTKDEPVLHPQNGLVASVIGRTGPEAPFVTWNISTKYDTALADRPVPGSYNLHLERVTDEHREAWEQWMNYGTPIILGGNVLENFTVDLPGGLGGNLSSGSAVLRLGPALHQFKDEPAIRNRLVIEDTNGTVLTKRLFTFRLVGRGIAGGQHFQGTDDEGYIGIDSYLMPGTATDGATTATGVAIKLKASMPADRWVGEPAQRVLPALRFCAAWGNNNLLRFGDEFGLQTGEQTFDLTNAPQVPPVLIAAVEDLVRISTAIKRPIALPKNIELSADYNGFDLHDIADAVAGLKPRFLIHNELVHEYDDDELTAHAHTGKLIVPCPIPFPLLGDEFQFEFSLEVTGEIELVHVEPRNDDGRSRKAVRLIPTATTHGRLLWDRQD